MLGCSQKHKKVYFGESCEMDDIFQKDSVSLGSIMVKQVNMYFGKEPNFESIYGSALSYPPHCDGNSRQSWKYHRYQSQVFFLPYFINLKLLFNSVVMVWCTVNKCTGFLVKLAQVRDEVAWNSSGGVSALCVRKKYQLLFTFTSQLKLLLTQLVWMSVFPT